MLKKLKEHAEKYYGKAHSFTVFPGHYYTFFAGDVLISAIPIMLDGEKLVGFDLFAANPEDNREVPALWI